MDDEIFDGIEYSLKQALAYARGEIELPNTTYETTWPDCPGGCAHMQHDLDCELKERCLVELCDDECCRVGRPSKYMKV